MEALKLSSNVTEPHGAFHTILAAGNTLSTTSEAVVPVHAQRQLEEFEDVSVTGEDMSSQNPLINRTLSNGASKTMESEDEGPRIQAFAKLEYADGVSYITTYQVEIGRDTDAERLAKQQEYGNKPYPERLPQDDGSSSGNVHRSSRAKKQRKSRNMASSVVSESGGIMGPGLHGSGRMSRSKTSFSATSSNYSASRRSSVHFMSSGEKFSDFPLEEQYDGSRPVDPIAHLPSPEGCPLIKIHPPMTTEGAANGYRGISRRHVKIAYNFEKRLFEMEVIGMNGAFVDEEHFKAGEIKELTNGCYIQIGNINMRFLLPDVALGETGAEGTADSDLMSFDFEDGRDEDMPVMESNDSSFESEEDEIAKNTIQAPNGLAKPHHKFTRLSVITDNGHVSTKPETSPQDDDDSQSEEGLDEEIEDEEKVVPVPKKKRSEKTKKVSAKQKAKIKLKVLPKPEAQPTPPIPKRKGPGRPPKNGLMSKREQALLVRQAKEAAKAEAMKNGTAKPGKVKEEKLVNMEDSQTPLSEAKTEKRKYTKRKKPEGLAEGQFEEPSAVRETIETADQLPSEQAGQVDAQPKQPKPPKAIKPPKSPSPVWDETKLTPEQLAKPSQSYVVLIHEALSDCPAGAMSLPKIYRAIERRYPYFKLRVQTIGWQSSVRHNLSQHPAFVKIEKDGKGWMWGLNPDVSIEKERKRRPSPPPSMPYPPPHPQHYQNPYGYPSYPPNGYPPPGYPSYGVPLGMQPVPGHHMPPHLHPSNPQVPNGFSFPLVAPLANGDSTYRSPYQPAPQSQQPPILTQQAAPQQLPSHNPMLDHLNPQMVIKPELESKNQDNAKAIAEAGETVPTELINALKSPTNNASLPLMSSQDHSVLQSQSSTPTTSSIRSRDFDLISHIGQDVLSAVGRFKKTLLESMSTNPDAEQIVTSAINRTLGIKPATAEPNGIEFPEEKPIMNALEGILQAIKDKKANQVPTPPASYTPQQHEGQTHGHQARSPPHPNSQPQIQLSSSIQQLRPPSHGSGTEPRPGDIVNKNELDDADDREDNEFTRGAKRGLEDDEDDGKEGQGQVQMSKRVAV